MILSARNILASLQGATFLAFAVVLVFDGAWRLAAAQVLLGIVTVLVYA